MAAASYSLRHFRFSALLFVRLSIRLYVFFVRSARPFFRPLFRLSVFFLCFLYFFFRSFVHQFYPPFICLFLRSPVLLFFLSDCLPSCLLSVCLSLCLSVYLSVCPLISSSIHSFNCISFPLLCLFFCPLACLSVSPAYPSACPLVRLSP